MKFLKVIAGTHIVCDKRRSRMQGPETETLLRPNRPSRTQGPETETLLRPKTIHVFYCSIQTRFKMKFLKVIAGTHIVCDKRRSRTQGPETETLLRPKMKFLKVIAGSPSANRSPVVGWPRDPAGPMYGLTIVQAERRVPRRRPCLDQSCSDQTATYFTVQFKPVSK